ncbi:hypothetical protein GHT06_020414 [Daphnia sinensis]|uniref:Integrase catalytic domain-containing protein n=1 Tax=Daphnia sinensis TaxID=1820382 RepID=A0AAD5KZJ7_9CRUS|nr:hypothetical protein GHT06_020414 [Daphnia sinensis]
MKTTAYHPQTDGLVERFNRTLCDMLACYVVDEPEEWDRYLPFVTFAYNTSQQTTLRDNPFYLFFGREPVLPNDIKINRNFEENENDHELYFRKWKSAQKLAREHLFKAQTKQKRYYDEGTKGVKYNVGELVLLKAPPAAGKFINRWNGPFKIIRNFSDITYEIQSLNDKKQKSIVHVNRLKFYTPRENLVDSEIKPNQNQNRKTEPRRKPGRPHQVIFPIPKPFSKE